MTLPPSACVPVVCKCCMSVADMKMKYKSGLSGENIKQCLVLHFCLNKMGGIIEELWSSGEPFY